MMKVSTLLAGAVMLALCYRAQPALAQSKTPRDWEPRIRGMTNAEAKEFAQQGTQSRSLTHEGDIAFSKGDLNKATECYRKALTIRSVNAEALAGIGYVEEKEGRMSEALKSFRDGLYFPNHASNTARPDVKLRMHYLFLLLAQEDSDGSPADAVTKATTPVATSPAATSAKGETPLSSQKWKDWREGVSLYESSIEMTTRHFGLSFDPSFYPHANPNERDVPALQAMAHAMLGLYQYYNENGHGAGCLSDFEAAVKLQPNLAIAHYFLGLTLAKGMTGKSAEAKAEFERAAALDKGSVRAAAEQELSKFTPSGYVDRYVPPTMSEASGRPGTLLEQ